MNKRKILGGLLFTLCCLSFVVVLVIPFMDYTKTEKASYMAGFYVFSQITWWASLPLLGKEMVQMMKGLGLSAWSRIRVK